MRVKKKNRGSSLPPRQYRKDAFTPFITRIDGRPCSKDKRPTPRAIADRNNTHKPLRDNKFDTTLLDEYKRKKRTAKSRIQCENKFREHKHDSASA